jgi:SSS family solute:Na+ symporter
LVLVALVAQNVESVLEAGLAIAGYTYGLLLGMFLLGFFSKRTHIRGIYVGVLVGAGVMVTVFLKNKGIWLEEYKIGWPWFVVIGSCSTMAVSYIMSLVLPKPSNQNSA